MMNIQSEIADAAGMGAVGVMDIDAAISMMWAGRWRACLPSIVGRRLDDAAAVCAAARKLGPR